MEEQFIKYFLSNLNTEQFNWVWVQKPKGEPRLELGVHVFGIILEFIR